MPGYYLEIGENGETGECFPCTFGCLSCTSVYYCETCQPGFFKNKFSAAEITAAFCDDQCYIGTLPFIPSILTSNVFPAGAVPSFPPPEVTDEEIQSGASSIALGANNVPYLEGEQLPYTINDLGQPTYDNILITIDCAPCL
jgi:hypothetical protein